MTWMIHTGTQLTLHYHWNAAVLCSDGQSCLIMCLSHLMMIWTAFQSHRNIAFIKCAIHSSKLWKFFRLKLPVQNAAHHMLGLQFSTSSKSKTTFSERNVQSEWSISLTGDLSVILSARRKSGCCNPEALNGMYVPIGMERRTEEIRLRLPISFHWDDRRESVSETTLQRR